MAQGGMLSRAREAFSQVKRNSSSTQVVVFGDFVDTEHRYPFLATLGRTSPEIAAGIKLQDTVKLVLVLTDVDGWTETERSRIAQSMNFRQGRECIRDLTQEQFAQLLDLTLPPAADRTPSAPPTPNGNGHKGTVREVLAQEEIRQQLLEWNVNLEAKSRIAEAKSMLARLQRKFPHKDVDLDAVMSAIGTLVDEHRERRPRVQERKPASPAPAGPSITELQSDLELEQQWRQEAEAKNKELVMENQRLRAEVTRLTPLSRTGKELQDENSRLVIRLKELEARAADAESYKEIAALVRKREHEKRT